MALSTPSDIKSKVPRMKLGERKTYTFGDDGKTFRGIPVPNIEVYGEKYGSIVKTNINWTDELKEFVWTCRENMISYRKVEQFLFEEVCSLPDIFKAVFNKDRERFDRGTSERRLMLKESVENLELFDDIRKSKEEIQYADSTTKLQMAILSKIDPEYVKRSEEKIDLTSSLANIIIAPKNEE